MLRSDFAGTLLADYHSVYRSYLVMRPQADAQFCLAHLIRDVKFLGESLAASDRWFAGELLVELTELFRLWHASQGAPADAALRTALVAQGERLERVVTDRVPQTKLAWNVVRRFVKHGKQYL